MDMTDAEMSRYAGALETLRQNGVYATYVGYHSTYMLQAHGGCNFLPWHRQYLFEFERELNRVAPGVTIPYWDWSKRSPDSPTPISQRFTHDPIWGRFGGAAGNAPIPNAPFRNWAPSGTPVTRDFRTGNGNVGGGGGRYTFLSSQDVAVLTSSIGEFGRFSDFLEANHNTPHVAVGATMSGVPTSPGDPIFWSHHAYVDYIWQRWQNAGNGNAFGGTQSNPVRTCTLDGEAYNPPIFGRTARRVFNEISSCTTYQPASRAGPTSRMSIVDTPDVDMRVVDRQDVAAAFGQVSSAAGSSALALSSAAEAQSYRAAIAQKKMTQPELYQAEVARGVSAVDSMIRAAQITGMSPEQVQSATQSYNVLLLKSGVDVVDDRDVVSSSAAAVAAEGRAEAASFSGASASAGASAPGGASAQASAPSGGSSAGAAAAGAPGSAGASASA
jgi:tyrosinase